MAHVIIADDDEIVLEMVEEAFRSYGHSVGCVRDGAAALQAIVATRPDLLILDCEMPIMSGILALRQVRLSRDYFALPVLMLTSHRAKADVDLALNQGADGYVKKPFDPHSLVFRAEELIVLKSKMWNPQRLSIGPDIITA